MEERSIGFARHPVYSSLCKVKRSCLGSMAGTRRDPVPDPGHWLYHRHRHPRYELPSPGPAVPPCPTSLEPPLHRVPQTLRPPSLPYRLPIPLCHVQLAPTRVCPFPEQGPIGPDPKSNRDWRFRKVSWLCLTTQESQTGSETSSAMNYDFVCLGKPLA